MVAAALGLVYRARSIAFWHVVVVVGSFSFLLIDKFIFILFLVFVAFILIVVLYFLYRS